MSGVFDFTMTLCETEPRNTPSIIEFPRAPITIISASDCAAYFTMASPASFDETTFFSGSAGSSALSIPSFLKTAAAWAAA